MTLLEKIEAANASVQPSDLEVRVARVSRDETWAELLVYKTARVDMQLLDRFIGPEKWNVRFEVYNGSQMTVVKATLSVDDGDASLIREGLSAVEGTDANAVKAAESDAFKRAGFALGLCRFLYDLPKIFVKLEKGEAQRVSSYGYFKLNSIKPLIVVDRNGKVRYEEKL
jgi:hypothetical protein